MLVTCLRVKRSVTHCRYFSPSSQFHKDVRRDGDGTCVRHPVAAVHSVLDIQARELCAGHHLIVRVQSAETKKPVMVITNHAELCPCICRLVGSVCRFQFRCLEFALHQWLNQQKPQVDPFTAISRAAHTDTRQGSWISFVRVTDPNDQRSAGSLRANLPTKHLSLFGLHDQGRSDTANSR